MTNNRPSPAFWRIALAFVGAPFVAAAAMAFAQPLYAGLPELSDRIWRTTVAYVLFGAYPTAIVFGLPAYLTLKRRFSLSLLNCIWAAAAVATFPWTLMGLVSQPEYAFSGGHVTDVDGSKTVWGWIGLMQMSLSMGFFGGIAGATFWFIAKWRAPHRTKSCPSHNKSVATSD